MHELPTTANEVLSLMANTSTEIDLFSDQVIESVKNGEVDPLKVLVQMKALEKASGRITKEIKDNCMNAADKYPGNSFEFMGNTIQKLDVHTEYDFKACEDSEWFRLDNLITDLKSKQKVRERFLRSLGEPTTILDESSGEITKIYPPIKKTTTGLKLTIR